MKEAGTYPNRNSQIRTNAQAKRMQLEGLLGEEV